MTDARFLGNDSVTCKAYHVKRKTLCSDVIKTFFQDQDQDLNFKTKTKTLKFFQDQDQDRN